MVPLVAKYDISCYEFNCFTTRITFLSHELACFFLKSRMKKIKNLSMSAGIVTMAILLGSALLAPTLSAYADQGKGKPLKGNDIPKSDPPKNNGPPKNDPPKNNDKGKSAGGNNGDDHAKGKKDPDKDKDNDHKACENGDKNTNGKYKHSCDSDHDVKK